jgi:hypothetical protein
MALGRHCRYKDSPAVVLDCGNMRRIFGRFRVSPSEPDGFMTIISDLRNGSECEKIGEK